MAAWRTLAARRMTRSLTTAASAGMATPRWGHRPEEQVAGQNLGLDPSGDVVIATVMRPRLTTFLHHRGWSGTSRSSGRVSA